MERFEDGGYMNDQDFISLCIAGKALPQQIDNFVEQWHKGALGRDKELAESLGMSAQEYGQWVRDPAALDGIIAAHTAQRRAG
jgi:hypothetical protein